MVLSDADHQEPNWKTRESVMKQKVGMVTIYRKNYGAFFQAYALQQVLVELGYDPQIIRYDHYRDFAIWGVPLKNIRNPFSFVKRMMVELVRRKEHLERERVFQESVRKHIRESDGYYPSYRALQKAQPQYDIYLVGSDQVLNPDLASKPAYNVRLLNFVNSGVKASYAASAGVGFLDKKWLSEIRKALSSFDFISVREESLAESIQQELHLEVQRHIDPTFLLGREEWGRFAQIPSCINDKAYIFYYRVLPQEALLETASKISQETGLPVFVADGNDCFEHMLRPDGYLSPEEWMGALINAAYVVTNSFHGTALSVRLNKKVCVVVPPAGKARVIELLQNCNLNRLTEKKVISDQELTILYEKANRYFETEGTRAKEYLKKLGGKDDGRSGGI